MKAWELFCLSEGLKAKRWQRHKEVKESSAEYEQSIWISVIFRIYEQTFARNQQNMQPGTFFLLPFSLKSDLIYLDFNTVSN